MKKTSRAKQTVKEDVEMEDDTQVKAEADASDGLVNEEAAVEKPKRSTKKGAKAVKEEPESESAATEAAPKRKAKKVAAAEDNAAEAEAPKKRSARGKK